MKNNQLSGLYAGPSSGIGSMNSQGKKQFNSNVNNSKPPGSKAEAL